MLHLLRLILFLYASSAIADDGLNEQISSFMQELEIPGLALAIYDGNREEIISYGVMNKETLKPIAKDTIFEIASVTKVFTSTALALHVLDGTMALNDPITKYLPAINGSFGEIHKVTLLNLATHSSSLPRVVPSKGRQLPNRHQIIDFIRHWHPNTPIGSHYLYSNLAFGLIGYALENVENRTFQEVMMHDILGPLEMRHTFTDVPPESMHLYAQGYGPKGHPAPKRPDNHLPGGGALRSTASDMLQFLKANLNLIGPEKLRKAMQETQKPFFKANENLTIGLGWQLVQMDGMHVVDKNGGLPGFSSYIGMIPEKRLGVVILMNKTKAESTKLGRRLLKFLAKRASSPSNGHPQGPPPA